MAHAVGYHLSFAGGHGYAADHVTERGQRVILPLLHRVEQSVYSHTP